MSIDDKVDSQKTSINWLKKERERSRTYRGVRTIIDLSYNARFSMHRHRATMPANKKKKTEILFDFFLTEGLKIGIYAIAPYSIYSIVQTIADINKV